MDSIGFIGPGKMGLPMASNLARKGFSLTIFDVVADPVRRLGSLGARIASSVAEVATQSSIVITMLPTPPASGGDY